MFNAGLLFLEFNGVDDEHEREANEIPANWLIPAVEFKAFRQRHLPSKVNVLEFANQIGIAPRIVVGRLQHSRDIPYTHLNGLRQRFKWAVA